MAVFTVAFERCVQTHNDTTLAQTLRECFAELRISATLHCFTGCAIGEVIGMVNGTQDELVGMSQLVTTSGLALGPDNLAASGAPPAPATGGSPPCP